MKNYFNTNYPTVDSLKRRAKIRIPKFAFDYLSGGNNIELCLHRNTEDIRKICILPHYLRDYKAASTKVKLFNEIYSLLFGVAPIGLGGVIWPRAPEILAQAAYEHQIPFILSTVTTLSIERAAELTQGKMWFQLYHLREDSVTNDLLQRCKNNGVRTLVTLADAPTWGYRPKEIKNGLSIQPKIRLNNLIQMMFSPLWSIRTLHNGQPKFETLIKYMPRKVKMKYLGKFMEKTFDGRVNIEKLKRLRDKWDGNLVLKGVLSEEDCENAVKLGFDGIIISNHGGRQSDCSPSTISVIRNIIPSYKGKIKIMMDSGICDGMDVARTLAAGVDFSFLGRSFMYGVAALGNNGGHHIINMLRKQLIQIMEQCSCQQIDEIRNNVWQKI